MSELRYDPIKGRWSIIADERKQRPNEFLLPENRATINVPSPCTYHEDASKLAEIMVIPASEKQYDSSWQVRVVANQFPVLRVEGDVSREGVGLYDRVNGIGAHEVIVEHPDPNIDMADMKLQELVSVFEAYKARLVDLRRDSRLRYILIFKNRGGDAGGTMHHSISQLIATPIIPTVLVQELNAARHHFHHKERCIFCDMIRQERRLGERIALATDRFVAIEPFASATPFETWILPLEHKHDFADASDDDFLGLAIILRDFLRRMRSLLDDPPFNLVLHNSPSPHKRPGQPSYWTTIEHDFHWHLEIVPRITRIAGFEWGSGYSINPTPPEEAARFLKEADPDGGD